MAPLSSTCESFWQMIIENKVTLIIMLCPEEEREKVS
jgi:protein tyrosine phosphatase